MNNNFQLPHYTCHKEVAAAKIHTIYLAGRRVVVELPDGNGTLVTLWVSQEYLDRAKPQPGGYFVVYEDGYMSYSPAKAFENGYKLKE